MSDPPPTEEGWFCLHDLRRVDWEAWRSAPATERDRAVSEGADFLADAESLAVLDADEGGSAVCSVLGHEADLMFLHFRPTLDDLSALERRFESTGFAGFTERVDSYVSVTEVSGYVSQAYFADGDVDEGTRRYVEGKLHPDLPEDEYVSFYPMSRRRSGDHNWYALDFEERADLLADHGETGREFAGRVTQVISASSGFDDHEWGVTLFGADPTDLKRIVYEMRFDDASALYGEFGDFHVGRRFPPADLGAYLDGERVPTSEAGATPGGESDATADGAAASSDRGDATGGAPVAVASNGDGAVTAGTDAEGLRAALADLDVYAGQPRGEDVHATVVYSEADVDDLVDAVDGLRSNFNHYDTHERTAVYEARDGNTAAVVSVWSTASAAETAAGFLSDLPGVVDRPGETDGGFGTMGMFYAVEPAHREAFLDRFDDVVDALDDREGHVETTLLVNRADENETFIASQWRSRDDAMAFFRSDAFRDTVDWGREILADRPRHVFLE